MSAARIRLSTLVLALVLLSALVVGCESLPQAEANGQIKTTAAVGERVTLSYRIAGGGGCTTYDDQATAAWIITPAEGATLDGSTFIATKPGTYSVTVPLPPDNTTDAAPATIVVTGAEATGDSGTAFSEDTGEDGSTDGDSAAADGKLWMVGNDGGVENGGKPATVTLASASHIDEIWTYHYNNGAGAPAGIITMTSADGTVVGTFQADLMNGVYWVAKVDLDVPAGTYTISDSDPATWSQNGATDGQGHTWAMGTAGQ